MKVFEGKEIILLTKHKKEIVIRPIIEEATGGFLLVDDQFDTDRLGTFSREIKRSKSQIETARKKIKIALKRSKLEIGIASEGSFGAHPMAPIPWNIEMVLLYDKKEKLEVFGVYEGSQTNFGHIIALKYETVLEFAQKIGFPEHYLILRPDNEKSKHIIKEIDSYDKLEMAYNWCVSNSIKGEVFVETDMRAHANPTRMLNIEKATQNLIVNLMQFCPNCGAPGYMVKEVVSGLPCKVCELPSDLTLKVVYGCYKCKHKSEVLYPKGKFASPQFCHHCNP